MICPVFFTQGGSVVAHIAQNRCLLLQPGPNIALRSGVMLATEPSVIEWAFVGTCSYAEIGGLALAIYRDRLYCAGAELSQKDKEALIKFLRG